MSKEEVINRIHANEWLMGFIKGNKGILEFTISNIPVVVYKKGIGTELYYRIPHNPSYDYTCVVDFLKYAIPEISKELEAYREKKLMSDYCIKFNQ